jgi:hypothetical protein
VKESGKWRANKNLKPPNTNLEVGDECPGHYRYLYMYFSLLLQKKSSLI